MPILSKEVKDTGYNMNHKWTGGLTTSISAYGFTLSAALDVRYGGHMFSRTKNLMQFTGNGVVTTYNDRKPFVIPNSARAIRDNNGNIVSYVENTTPVKMSDSVIRLILTTMVTAMGDWPIWQTALTPNCVISPFLGSCRRSGSIQSISAVYQSLLS